MSAPGIAISTDPTAALPKSARRGVWWPLRLLAWIAATAVLSGVVVAPLDTWSQAMFGATIFVLAFLISRVVRTRYMTLVLILLSVTMSLRYLYWRATTTVGNDVGVDLVLGLILFMAEVYAVLVLILGYSQMAWPLRRRPVALPADTSTWPSVDLYIPTYNEPLSVVRTTVLAAKMIDWPADKLNVYILDDGRRDQFRAFAAEAGVGYIIRPDNKHAKAGNINHALKKTRGDLIAIFDCDHVPTRSFLQLTVGWFMRDAGLGMVQTPHHFYSPDPFEKNLGNFKRVPNEGELFYGVIQNGNDLWNASFFCGSCAVIRRAPLESIGGIAPETVTEDAHTMLKLHRRGWRSAYIDIPQAGGLATENLAGHVGQRIRWARGMAQIFRIDNPFLGRGLKLTQRICYASAMLHFFYGIPRIIFLLAPLPFLLFDAHIFNASAATILAFALPHMAHAYLTSSRVQGAHRHSFWAEVYEATLATYITYPTTLALISPKLGKFNVTAKGGISEVEYFDIRIAGPYLVLLGLNLIGMGVGLWKALQPGAETGAIVINMVWSGYAFLILTATLAVAWEKRQRRIVPRVAARLPAMLRLPDQKMLACETVDLSITGMALRTPTELSLGKDDLVEITIRSGLREAPAEARVVQKQGLILRLRFEHLPIEAEETIVNAVFGRPTAWTDWKKGRKVDRPLLALFTILALGVRGAMSLPRWLMARKRAAAILIAASLGAAAGGGSSHATGWTLEGLGYGQAQQKYNRRTSVRLPFFARGDRVFTAANLTLEFDQSAKVPDVVKALKVSMNDEVVAEVVIADMPPQLVLDIPPQLLEEKNALSFELVLRADSACPGLVDIGTWSFLRGGHLETKAAPLPLPNELDMLPLPFFDPSADALTPIHIVFPSAPDAAMMKVGGLVAAYFGLRAGARFTFPVHFRELPEEHCVLLLTPQDAGMIPDLGEITGPMVALRDNPAKAETAKVLIIAGRDVAELERAAKRLVFDYEATKGAAATKVFDGWLPPETDREPYDAPRWFQSGQPLRLGLAASDAQRHFEGGLGGTIAIELRIPPDVFTWPDQFITLDLQWRSLVPPGVERPDLKIEINKHFLGTIELAADAQDAEHQSKSLRIPVSELAGFNVLYVHVVPPVTSCPSAEHDIVSVDVLPDSTLHLEGYPSFRPMPDLETFVDDGYPFTRMADLSETTVLLPEKPLPEEVGTTLSALAHTTAVTGVPPTRVSFQFGDPSSGALTNKDLLVIGVGERLRVLNQWEDQLPLRGLGHGTVELPYIPWYRRVLAFSRGQPLEDDLTRLAQAVRPGEDRAYVLGVESPYASGRSVVIIAGQTPAVMPSVAELRGFSEALSQQADVLVRSGPRRASFHIQESYDTGSISPYKQFLWFVTRHWLLMVPTLLVSALLFAWVLKKRLANVEYKRLAHVEAPK